MNGAERIKDRIIADARVACEKILEDARQEARNIIANAEKEAFQRITVMTEKAKEEAVQIKQRFNAVTELEDRKKALKARQDAIDEAFGMALDRLAVLPQDQYTRFLEQILMEAAREEDGFLVFNKGDKERLGKKFVSNINDKLKKAGKGRLTLADDELKARGGFVLKYGDMEVNCTLEILLSMVRSDLETDVAAILFND